MEEQVGEIWHRWITRAASTRFPAAKVELDEVVGTVGVLFRALGGDSGLQVSSAEASTHAARRSWLQRLAGSHRRVALAWRDAGFLRLPATIDWFPERHLNRDLFLWLTALAVGDDGRPGPWFQKNQRLSAQALSQFPGLRPRYRRLVDAHLVLRPDPQRLPAADAERERAIQDALAQPGSRAEFPRARRAPQPVPLWLHPAPPSPEAALSAAADPDDPGHSRQHTRALDRLRRKAERTEMSEQDRGLVTIRMENLFTWGEFVKVDRGSEDEDDLDRAEAIARDLDRLVVTRGGKATGATLKFDLDLPAEAEDDHVLGDGILLPEWHWRRQALQPDHCRIVPMLSANSMPCALPDRLRRTARRLRHQFQALAPARVWQRAQADGQEIDIDAYLRYAAARASGIGTGADALYREMRAGSRDLACLLMADLSLSTDTWINDHCRVIDVIRDSLFLFAESLAATGDQFGIYGFSSRKRDPVRVHLLKAFSETYNDRVRGRIQAIKPGYYTRLGAAVRFGSQLLSERPAGRRLLLLLTDGKPNDIDKYEGRYGIEDTRQAVLEAKRLGLQPFCVTIDRQANDYLPHLFGSKGYVVIRQPAELPERLPLLYAQFTT